MACEDVTLGPQPADPLFVCALVEAPQANAGQQERRAAQLAQEINTLKAHLVAAREQYETIKARNRSELSRLGLERETDFRRMMATFAANQAQLLHSSAELWGSLATQLAAPYEPMAAAP